MGYIACLGYVNRVLHNRFILCLLQTTLHVAMATVPTYYANDYCSNTLDMAVAKVNAGRLLLHRPDQKIQTLDCQMLIRAPGNKMLTFRFHQFDLRSADGCHNNYLQIFGDARGHLSLTDKICNANRPDRTYVTSGEEALIQVTKEQFQEDTMELVFTAFRFAPCFSGEYLCGNSHCIAHDLYCNGYDNCGDRSDICILRKETIIGLVVAAAILLFLCTVAITVFLIRRQRKIRRERVSG